MSKKTHQTAVESTPLPLRLLTAIVGPLTWQNAKMWLKLIAIVLVIRWLWFEPFFIPSGSMEPTIHGDPRFFRGDRVAVNKLAYGPRIPFTTHRFLHIDAPKRWEIVVFDNVEEGNAHKKLIKRVIGLPGERVHIEDGKIHINGEALELPPSMPEVYYTQQLEPSDEDVQRVIEHDNPPVPKDVIKSELQRRIKQMSPLRYGVLKDDEYSVVPKGHYLLMGDNSPHSLDGRYFGWVPEGHIVGRAFCTWWPVTRWRDFTGFSDTWWGAGLLYGIPLLIVLYELITSFVAFTWRVQHGFSDGTLKKGERVVICRAAFGVNVPFTNIALKPGRVPRDGEVVLVVPPDGKGATGGPLLARVLGQSAEGNGVVTVTPEDAAGDSGSIRVSRDGLLGSVTAVWRPFSRMRRVPAGKG